MEFQNGIGVTILRPLRVAPNIYKNVNKVTKITCITVGVSDVKAEGSELLLSGVLWLDLAILDKGVPDEIRFCLLSMLRDFIKISFQFSGNPFLNFFARILSNPAPIKAASSKFKRRYIFPDPVETTFLSNLPVTIELCHN